MTRFRALADFISEVMGTQSYLESLRYVQNMGYLPS